MNQMLENATTWLIATVGAGLLWIIRRILTNEKQIAQLASEIAHRDAMARSDESRRTKQRDEDRATVHDINAKVDALLSRGPRG